MRFITLLGAFAAVLIVGVAMSDVHAQPGKGKGGKGGPAETAGIKGGDSIVKFGDSRIGNLDDFDSALRKFKAGDRVPVLVKRGSEELKFEVTLEPPR